MGFPTYFNFKKEQLSRQLFEEIRFGCKHVPKVLLVLIAWHDL